MKRISALPNPWNNSRPLSTVGGEDSVITVEMVMI